MHVLVRLLKGYKEPLSYAVPPHYQALVREGSVVLVPLRKQEVAGLVVKVLHTHKQQAYVVREISSLFKFPEDARFFAFIEKVAQLYFTDAARLWARLSTFVFGAGASSAEEEASVQLPFSSSHTLTDEQSAAVYAVWQDVSAGLYRPTLLQGVTGSGKTEVYQELIARTIAAGKSVIFLCPEISLARYMQARLAQYFNQSISIGSWHAATGACERKQVWQWALAGMPMLLIGVHQPVLLPLQNLGLIIIDEEHDGGFEEKQHPKINSKHVALLRAREYGIPIVLGSATPSVATLHYAAQQGWRHCFLKTRFGGTFPNVEHVLLPSEKKRPHFWVSKALLAGLQDTVFAGRQALVYLNRRGYGFFSQCSDCGFIFQCSACAVSLTLHQEEAGGGFSRSLECHYCSFRMPLPPRCTQCQASTDTSKSKGIGTQQLVEILKKLLPEARIGRADADVSRKKKEWQTTMAAFAAGEIDILVGTQIITKGFHFPRLVLVGVVWADSAVHFPVYNAHEVALQQLIQVAGRAGRSLLPGRVIVQSFDNHPLFSCMSEQEYPRFCEQELEARREFGYPPFGRLITVEIAHASEEQVEADAAFVKSRIAVAADPSIEVLGPAKPLRSKVDGVFYRHILCKAEKYGPLHRMLSGLSWSDVQSMVMVHPL